MKDLTRHLQANPPKEIDVYLARAIWRQYRTDHGFAPNAKILGQPGSNVKTAKNALPTYTLSLLPQKSSGVWNTCRYATPECMFTCLVDIGHGGSPDVINGRKLRTLFLGDQPDAMLTLIKAELEAAVVKHGAIGARLNDVSDIPWELVAPWLLEVGNVTFYDYTKWWQRTSSERYHLTYSASERTDSQAIADRCARGDNVAVVLSVKHKPGAKVQSPLPTTYAGTIVLDGDKNDERFNDPTGQVIGLRAKGKAALLPVGGFVKAAF